MGSKRQSRRWVGLGRNFVTSLIITLSLGDGAQPVYAAPAPSTDIVVNCLEEYAAIGLGPCDESVIGENTHCPEFLLPGYCCVEVNRLIPGLCLQQCPRIDYEIFPCSAGGTGTAVSTAVTGGTDPGFGSGTGAGSGSGETTGQTTGSGAGTDTTAADPVLVESGTMGSGVIGNDPPPTESGSASADGSGVGEGSTSGTGVGSGDATGGSGTATGGLPTCMIGSCPGVRLIEPCYLGSPEKCALPTDIGHAGFCSNYACGFVDDPLPTDDGSGSVVGASTSGTTTSDDGSGAATGSSTTGNGSGVTTTGSDTGSITGSGSETTGIGATGDGSGSADGSGVDAGSTTGTGVGSGDVTGGSGTSTGGLPTCIFGFCPGLILPDPCLAGSPETCTPPTNIGHAGFCSSYPACVFVDDPPPTDDGSATGAGASTSSTTTSDSGSGTTGSSTTGSGSTTTGSDTGSGSETTGSGSSSDGSGTGEGASTYSTTTSDSGSSTTGSSTTGSGSTTTGSDTVSGSETTGSGSSSDGSGTGEGASTSSTTTSDSGSGTTGSSTMGSGSTTTGSDTGNGTGSGSETTGAGSSGEGSGSTAGTGVESGVTTGGSGTSTEELPRCGFGSCPGLLLPDPCLAGSPESCTPPDDIGHAGFCSKYSCGDEGSGTTGSSTGSDSGGATTASGSGSDGTDGETDTGGSLQGGQLTVEPACVMQNIDGSRTAYLTYENLSSSELIVVTNPATGAINELVANGEQLAPITNFSPGRHVGVFAVTFRGSTLQWQVKPAGAGPSTARVDAGTVACAPVKPLVECAQKIVDRRIALFGYENSNPFTMQIPAGPLNKVTPGELERGQPTQFQPGLHKGVVSVSVGDSQAWSLNGVQANIGASLPECPVDCIDQNTSVILSNLDTVALELTNVTKRAALQLIKARPSGKDRRDLTGVMSSARIDAQRAAARSERYLKLARSLTINWPLITAACPNKPQLCRSVERSTEIAQLRDLYSVSRALTARAVMRAKFIAYGKRQHSNPLIRKARRLEMIGNEQLRKLAPTVEDCR